ncbi:apolipoprotein acyltransferase [Pontibaca methylaminivorans]|uniref:apolipoprotein acyltransferase n=1 Tax=Pontibaca methylaminivorans TaxID=515897 RepID=UPI002FDA682E
MIVILFAAFGALIGGVTARRRGGNRLDIAQYAAGYGLAFMILGMIVALVLDRFLI